MDLLFTMVHWHGLTKLHMHSDITLDILDQQTTDLGEQCHQFKANVCTAYQTQELNREVDTQYCWQAKETAKWSEGGQVNATMEGKSKSGAVARCTNIKAIAQDEVVQFWHLQVSCTGRLHDFHPLLWNNGFI
jgi:hypothetical protein